MSMTTKEEKNYLLWNFKTDQVSYIMLSYTYIGIRNNNDQFLKSLF